MDTTSKCHNATGISSKAIHVIIFNKDFIPRLFVHTKEAKPPKLIIH